MSINSGDTAWLLLCGVLVLMMTIPGLVLFYGGMVRRKDVLAIMMQSVVICFAVTLLWIAVGYSLAFSNGNRWIGGLSAIGLANLSQGWNQAFTLGAGLPGAQPMTVPQSAFVFFQMTFAIIAPAVITGSFADRMRLRALLLLTMGWSLFVYAPVAHWVWSPGGWLHLMGLGDYAGGTVVEINAGVAGLMCSIMLGRRIGYAGKALGPTGLGTAVVGASLLWVGWLGFNSGAAGGANGNAGMAVLATQAAAAAAAAVWTALEWRLRGAPSALGVISGAVAGLVAITPAAGYVLPLPALAIGAAAGAACYFAVNSLKAALDYDDSLDVFGVHGVGGIVGTLAVGVCAFAPLSHGAVTAGWHQLGVQAAGTVATVVYCATVTWLLLKLIDVTVGLRVSAKAEVAGLDTGWEESASF